MVEGDDAKRNFRLRQWRRLAFLFFFLHKSIAHFTYTNLKVQILNSELTKYFNFMCKNVLKQISAMNHI